MKKIYIKLDYNKFSIFFRIYLIFHIKHHELMGMVNHKKKKPDKKGNFLLSFSNHIIQWKIFCKLRFPSFSYVERNTF